MVSVITALKKHPNAKAIFWGRAGGFSKGVYESLNCGLATDDPHLMQNRELVRNNMGAAHLLSLYQVHGDVCHVITPDNAAESVASRPQGDAMVTAHPQIALGVLTADCAPVLFYGQTQKGAPIIGAAHAGWGGAFRGVLEATIDTMKNQGAEPETITASIGPCIAQENYEVTQEFVDRFIEQSRSHSAFFKSGKGEAHFMFDLAGYVEHRLCAAGLTSIEQCRRDTYALEDEYFSFRRATHRKEPDYGRQISTIMIAPVVKA
jgi:YfiH family protein